MSEIETPVYDLTYLDASQKRVAALREELAEAQDVAKGVQARLDAAEADQNACLQSMQSNPATAQLFSSITRTVRKARSPSVKISLQEIYDMACNSEGDGKFTVKEEELSPKQKQYRAFFEKSLKKFGAKSPADLDDAKKKEFFNYIQKNWKG